MPKPLNARSVMAKLHAWLGGLGALFIFAITVSGMVIAFSAPLLHLETGAMPDVQNRPSGTSVDIGSLVTRVRAATEATYIPLGYLGPNAEISTNVEMIYGLSAPSDQGGETQIFTFDPATNERLGTIFLDRTMTHQLIDFHYELLAGGTGAVCVAVLGLLMAGLAAVGLYLWWPRNRSLLSKLVSMRFQGSALQLNFNLHSFFGFIASILIVVWALTGVYWSQPNWGPDLIRPATAQLSEDAAKMFHHTTCDSTVTIAGAVDIAIEANPGSMLWEAEFAAPWQPYHTIYLSTGNDIDKKDGDARVWVSSTCKDLVVSATVNGMGSIGAASASIHSAESFGPARIPLLLFIGILLTLLTVTGVVVWLRQHVFRAIR